MYLRNPVRWLWVIFVLMISDTVPVTYLCAYPSFFFAEAGTVFHPAFCFICQFCRRRKRQLSQYTEADTTGIVYRLWIYSIYVAGSLFLDVKGLK